MKQNLVGGISGIFLIALGLFSCSAPAEPFGLPGNGGNDGGGVVPIDPMLEIIGPSTVNQYEEYSFQLSHAFGPVSSLTVQWSGTNIDVVSGQGTENVVIRFNSAGNIQLNTRLTNGNSWDCTKIITVVGQVTYPADNNFTWIITNNPVTYEENGATMYAVEAYIESEYPVKADIDISVGGSLGIKLFSYDLIFKIGTSKSP